ncbi:MAG: hypothetical protein KAS15_00865 [Nanoarchaeota archaeon]|nr:hypothetical protein [Nanoarchaeota archaeon]
MDDKIFTTVIRMETKQDAMLVDLAAIKTKVSRLPCEVSTYKIKTLQKVVYGAVAVVLLAFMANLATPAKSATIRLEKAPMSSTISPGTKPLIKCDADYANKINKN